MIDRTHLRALAVGTLEQHERLREIFAVPVANAALECELATGVLALLDEPQGEVTELRAALLAETERAEKADANRRIWEDMSYLIARGYNEWEAEGIGTMDKVEVDARREAIEEAVYRLEHIPLRADRFGNWHCGHDEGWDDAVACAIATVRTLLATPTATETEQ